jgi:spore maturation protein CgeB
LPTYRDGAELSKLVQHYKSSPEERLELVEKLRAHVISRHSYTRRAFEFLEHLRDVSNSSVRYAIKIPVPRREVAAEWGDFHFAVALAKGLRQAGNSARIDFLPEWARGGGEGDDVSIVLRGLSKFDTARSKTVNIQWLISHPDKVDVEELNAYDLVFVASEKHAVKLARQCAKPVRVLLQCTDVERFLPATNEALDGVGSDLLFVGNSRNQYRKIIRDALEMGLRPEVYGARWEQFIPAEFIRGNNLPNELLPRSYQAARVVLNDHWEDMAKGGFLSNRLFDVVAAGGVAVSDRCDGLESIFEGAVVTYADPEELPAAIQRAGAIRRDSPDYLAAHLRIRSQHSFLARAREIDAASRQLIGYF